MLHDSCSKAAESTIGSPSSRSALPNKYGYKQIQGLSGKADLPF